jgi:hypothetical protein
MFEPLPKSVTKWIYPVIVMFIIFIFSSIPGAVLNDNGLGRNDLHISGHSIMFFLLCFSYYKATKDIGKSIIFSVLYGLFDELHQLYTPLRSASMFDLYTDTIGALIAGLILWKSHLILPKKLKNWLNK